MDRSWRVLINIDGNIYTISNITEDEANFYCTKAVSRGWGYEMYCGDELVNSHVA